MLPFKSADHRGRAASGCHDQFRKKTDGVISVLVGRDAVCGTAHVRVRRGLVPVLLLGGQAGAGQQAEQLGHARVVPHRARLLGPCQQHLDRPQHRVRRVRIRGLGVNADFFQRVCEDLLCRGVLDGEFLARVRRRLDAQGWPQLTAPAAPRTCAMRTAVPSIAISCCPSNPPPGSR
jgi:hypothetical protein